MDDLRNRIEAFLSRPGYSPMRRRELARAMSVAAEDYALFREALDDMERRGAVIVGHGRRYALPGRAGLVRGRIEVKGGRYGFLKPREPGAQDLFVPPKLLGGAMDGDVVLASLEPRRRERRKGGRGKRGPVARVMKILERGVHRVTGVFLSTGRGSGIVVPGSRAIPEVSIRGADTGGALDGRKVSVEITRYPEPDRPALGRIARVLGEAGTWEAERAARIEEFGLRAEFPEEIEREAAELPAELPEDELARRADYTNEIAVTIDPDDARDHDDAISVARQGVKGGWRLRVHIADVAWYVRPGTAIDTEARARATSVYLPGEVFRMLPERLSAELCSLLEGELRPTRTVTMHFDAEGRLKRTVVERSVIRSAKRLTFGQVRRALGEDGEGEHVPEITGDVLGMLRDGRELHEKLRDLRTREGSLDFSLPEVRVVLGDDGRVAAVTREVQDLSHHMIEEFMLAANRTVAELLAERGFPGIYRIHEDPDDDALRELAKSCRELGIVLKPPYSRQKLSRAVAKAFEEGVGETVAGALLRSMKLARYHEQALAHYALAFDRYCHFTSPIRRYPDLWMHRLLDALFEPGRPSISKERAREGQSRGLEPATGIAHAELAAEVAHLAEHCSIRERAAERAERELTRFRQLEFLREHADGTHEAVVRDLDEGGLKVEIERFWVGARAPVANLPGDGYRYSERKRLLTARRGRSFRVGDRVKLRIEEVDLVAMRVIAAVVS